MHNDDRPHGRLLTRRQLVALFGASAAAAAVHRSALLADAPAAGQAVQAAAGAAPNCIAIPQQTEGPYFVDEKLLRSDIRQDPSNGKVSAGAAFNLRLNVTSIDTAGRCTPLAGALVDLWQCDAAGVYSDARDQSFDTIGQKFLRGYQVSDTSGAVQFTTIYPGWYPGRAVHIHFKIRVPAAGGQGAEFVSQFYFAEELTDRVHAREPYAAHRGQRLRNDRDMIFRDGGAQLMLPAAVSGQGYTATFNVAMQPGSRPPAGPGGAGRGGRGGRGRG